MGKGSYCVVERHADGGACSVPDYAVIKFFRHIVRGEGPDTIARGSTRPSRRCRRGMTRCVRTGYSLRGSGSCCPLHGPQRQTPLCCCWMRSPPIWMPRRRPVYGRPCVRPPVGAPSSPFPTASMRVLAAGLWRSGPKDSKCRECSPGGHGASGAVKNRGKKRLTVPMGSAMMGCGQKRPISAINGGECSWIAAEVQDEAGYAAHRDTDTGCGHPWTGADHILLCRVLLHRTGDVLLWQLSLRRCILRPFCPK